MKQLIVLPLHRAELIFSWYCFTFRWDKNATTAAGAAGAASAAQANTPSAHSHYNAAIAAQSAPATQTAPTAPTAVNAPAQSMVFAGEDITTWADSGTSNQRKRSVDPHPHRLRRRGNALVSFFTSPEFRKEVMESRLGQELTHDTKKDVAMAALGGAGMVGGMGVISHFLGGKKNATTGATSGSPVAGGSPGVSLHSHFSSAGVAAAQPPQYAPSEAVDNSASDSTPSPSGADSDGGSSTAQPSSKKEKEEERKKKDAKAKKEKEREALEESSSSGSPTSNKAPSEAVLRKRGDDE